MKTRSVSKTLAVAVIILFLGLAIQPSVAVQPETELDIEPKDYLFETIIDIANNPEVKELFEEYGNNIYDLDYNYKGILLKILFNNPKLLFSKLFTKPKITSEYLNSVFNEGCEIVDIIGEDKALEMVKSVKFTNPDIVDDLHNIVLNDEELSNRFTTLTELNLGSLEEPPMICVILVILLLKCGATVIICMNLYEIIQNYPILIMLIYPPFMLNLGVFQICFFLAIVFQCIDFPYP